MEVECCIVDLTGPPINEENQISAELVVKKKKKPKNF